MTQPLVLVCAGGTGGHLFPAEALSVALAARGCTVDLVTDERAEKYGRAFPARAGWQMLPGRALAQAISARRVRCWTWGWSPRLMTQWLISGHQPGQ